MNKQILQKLIHQIAENKKEITTLKAKVTRLENKAKDGKLNGSYEYFDNMPESELDYYLTKFNISRKDLLKELETARDWLEANGKRKSNYRSYMGTWIRKHYTQLTEEQIKRNQENQIKVQRLKSKLYR